MLSLSSSKKRLAPRLLSLFCNAEIIKGVELILPMPSSSSATNPDVSRLESGGVQVRYSTTLYMHAKLIIVDSTLGFTGSENFSSNSLDNNRELGIVIGDPQAVGMPAGCALLASWHKLRLPAARCCVEELPSIPQQTTLKSCSHSGGAGIDIEFEINIRDMGADRANTDAKASRNLFAAFASRNGPQDFSLAVGQGFGRRYGRRLRRNVRLEGNDGPGCGP